MEIALIWFLSVVSMGEQIKAVNNNVIALENKVEILSQDFVNLAGKHSSLHALQKLNHKNQQKQIDNINSILDNLQEN